MKIKMKLFVFFIIVLGSFSILFSGCSLNFLNFNKSSLKSELIDAKNSTSQEELVNKVAPAVVGIVASVGGYESVGTGVCVSSSGYILTNNHVIENSSNVKLYLYDGNTCLATVKWSSPSQDLAVLQASKEVPYLPMATKNSYKTGEEVFAIGTPIAIQFKHSVTKGIISAINRTLQVDTSVGTSTLASLIQHDASINPGNSGGPLINGFGEVIGINTAKITDAEGLGFAIPIDIARPIVDKLNTNGEYKSAYLGVIGYDVGFSNGFNRSQSGVYVVAVDENSPAYNLGIKKGDKITKINGEKVDNWLDMKTKIYQLDCNEEVTLTYINNSEQTQKIKLCSNPYN